MTDAQLQAVIANHQARIERLEGLSRSLLVELRQQDADHATALRNLQNQLTALQRRVFGTRG